MRSFLQECDETYLPKAGRKKLRNVTQQIIVPFCLFLKYHIFETSISIVVSTTVLYFLSCLFWTIFTFRIFREYFEKRKSRDNWNLLHSVNSSSKVTSGDFKWLPQWEIFSSRTKCCTPWIFNSSFKISCDFKKN